jgi:hypothetical protein
MEPTGDPPNTIFLAQWAHRPGVADNVMFVIGIDSAVRYSLVSRVSRLRTLRVENWEPRQALDRIGVIGLHQDVHVARRLTGNS